jgi:nicotinamidase-related amidase
VKTALCIVDMQPKFKASKFVVDNVITYAKRAIETKSPIVVLEYKGYGNTHIKILRVLETAPKGLVKFRTKPIDNGGPQFLEAIKWRRIKRVEICGVNGCACVNRTREGIERRGIEVERLEDAIACGSDLHWECYSKQISK